MMGPKCCQYAKDYILLAYDRDDEAEDTGYNLECYKLNKPYWLIRGVKSDVYSSKFEGAHQKISFCPSCGTKMPGIRLKAIQPKKVSIVTDGGYYCDTCGERLIACGCKQPSEMWEADYGKDKN